MINRCRTRVPKAVVALAATVLLSSGCGSYLSEKELISANNVQLQGRAGATGTVPTAPAAAPAAGQAAGIGTAAPAAPSSAAAVGRAASPAEPSSAGSAAGVNRPASSGGRVPSAPTPAPASAASAGPSTGSGGTGAGAPSPASGIPAPLAPGNGGSVIKLAQVGTRSGPLGAAMQPGWDAAPAWVADVNARGGLAGHPVQLITADDRGDPSQAVAVARRLVEQDGVIAFFGIPAPTTAQAILGYLETKGVPAIGSCICNTDQDKSPMMFEAGPGGSDGLAWEHFGAMVEGTDKRKVALFYCREAATCSNLLALYKKWAGPAGVQIVYEAQMSIAQPDYTAEVIQARNAGAEAIVGLADNATVVRIARSAHRQNYQPLIVAQHAASDERFIEAGGADVEGALVASTTAEWSTSAEMADYRQAMAQFAPNGIRGSMGSNVWTAGKLLEKAAARFPARPTSADVLEGLYSLRGETLGGKIPPTTFARGRSHADTNTCHVPAVIRGGKIVPLKGPTYFSCTPGWKPVTG